MSLASSTRQPAPPSSTNRPKSGSTSSSGSSRPSYLNGPRASNHALPNVARPTASSTSKATTPLLQPNRSLPPAHCRHQKSSSVSSTDSMPRLPLSDIPSYLNLENRTTHNGLPVNRLLSKTSSNFTSRIPVRSSNMSSKVSSEGPIATSSRSNLVLQPKANMASVSSTNLSTHRTARPPPVRSLNMSTSNLISQPSKPSSVVVRPIAARKPPPLRNVAVAPARTSATTSLVKSTARLTTSKSSNSSSTNLTDSKAGGLSNSHAPSISSLKPPSAPLRVNQASLSSKRLNTGATSSPSNNSQTQGAADIGRPKVISEGGKNGGIGKNAMGTNKPSLLSPFTSNPLLKSSSTCLLTPKLAGSQSSSSLVPSKSHLLKAASHSHTKEALGKSQSFSRIPRHGEPGSSSKPASKQQATTSRTTGNLHITTASNIKQSQAILNHHHLSKKSYTPRAVPKELSKIPSPPISSSYNGATQYSKRIHNPKSKTYSPMIASSTPVITTSTSHPHHNTHQQHQFERAASAFSTSSNYTAEPLKPEDVIKTFGSKLTSFEHKEIMAYPHIYYFGANAKKSCRDIDSHAFSTKDGDLMFNPSDHLAYRYEIQKTLGKGSFGQVLRAYDYKLGKEVAIKVIRNSERFRHQALTEIKILELLTKEDRHSQHNVLHFLDNFLFRGHLCIVTELYGINLYEHIKLNHFVGFRLPQVHNFAVQILQSLRLLASIDLIHCDLKPENILLAGPTNTEIKVIDFGSSCFSDQCIYTYIQSRFYRSPEVILELKYGPPIDMWSFGCILAELSNGQPIFPGETEAEQLACILEVLGLPDPALVAQSRRRYSFFDASGKPRASLSPRKKREVGSKPLRKILKNADTDYIDFVSRCLEFNPDKRMTPEQAMLHPWIVNSLPPSYSRNLTISSPEMLMHSVHSEEDEDLDDQKFSYSPPPSHRGYLNPQQAAAAAADSSRRL